MKLKPRALRNAEMRHRWEEREGIKVSLRWIGLVALHPRIPAPLLLPAPGKPSVVASSPSLCSLVLAYDINANSYLHTHLHSHTEATPKNENATSEHGHIGTRHIILKVAVPMRVVVFNSWVSSTCKTVQQQSSLLVLLSSINKYIIPYGNFGILSARA